VKTLTVHLLIFATLFAMACVFEIPASRSKQGATRGSWQADGQMTVEDPWRRTVNGWERITDWTPPPPPNYGPWTIVEIFHPALLAFTTLIVSVTMLLVLPVQVAVRNAVSVTTRETDSHHLGSPAKTAC
jgi:hypothetical protein